MALLLRSTTSSQSKAPYSAASIYRWKHILPNRQSFSVPFFHYCRPNRLLWIRRRACCILPPHRYPVPRFTHIHRNGMAKRKRIIRTLKLFFSVFSFKSLSFFHEEQQFQVISCVLPHKILSAKPTKQKNEIEKERTIMTNTKNGSNQGMVPEARAAMDRFKM